VQPLGYATTVVLLPLCLPALCLPALSFAGTVSLPPLVLAALLSGDRDREGYQ